MNALQTNVWVYPDQHIPLISECLTYKQKGYTFSPAFRAGYWDGKVCLLKEKQGRWRFAAGLLPYVQALLMARYLRGDIDNYPPFIWK